MKINYKNSVINFICMFQYFSRLSKHSQELLIFSLVQRIKSNIDLPDFNIDNSHELAIFIWNKGSGHTLVHDPVFCLSDGPDCATYVNTYPEMVSSSFS